MKARFQFTDIAVFAQAQWLALIMKTWVNVYLVHSLCPTASISLELFTGTCSLPCAGCPERPLISGLPLRISLHDLHLPHVTKGGCQVDAVAV